MKWRNSKERELLANGGSRDQTLPNKNNPNPDLSDAKCDRPQTPLSSNSPSPLNSSLSPPPSSQNFSFKEDLRNSFNTGTASTIHSPQSPSIIRMNNKAAAVVAFSMSSSTCMQKYASQTSLAVFKPQINSNDHLPLSISRSNSVSTVDYATTTTTASTSASSSKASSTACASTEGIVGQSLHMTNDDFKAKINSEMLKHLAETDIKLKIENSINDTKQRCLNVLTSQSSDLLSSNQANNLFIRNHMNDALPSHMHSHAHHGNNICFEHVHQMSATHAHRQHQPLTQAHFMKPFFDDYEDSNSDTDEEISVT